MRWVEHGGIRLCTESFGQAGDPALLLVMGATASMLGWPDALCAGLAARGLHVIRFDHRDTGQTTTAAPGRADYAVEDMAEDCVAILDAYGIAQAHLVGMSLGGYLAQMVAVRHPERVRSLVLIGSEPLGWDGAPLPHISPAFLDHFAGLASLDWHNQKAVTAFLLTSERLCHGADAPFDAVAAEVRVRAVLARTQSPASMFNHGTVGVRDTWTGSYRKIACPVLVIHGALDPILPVANGHAIAAGIAGTAMFILPGVGHALPAAWLPQIVARIAAHVGAG